MIYSYSSIIRTQAKDMGITLEALLRVPSVTASTTMRSALDFKCGPRSHFFFPLRGKYHAHQSLSELMHIDVSNGFAPLVWVSELIHTFFREHQQRPPPANPLPDHCPLHHLFKHISILLLSDLWNVKFMAWNAGTFFHAWVGIPNYLLLQVIDNVNLSS